MDKKVDNLGQIIKDMQAQLNDFLGVQLINDPNLSGMITETTYIDKNNGTEIISLCCKEKAVIFGTHHETERCPSCNQYIELKNGWRRVLT
tara:strand:- start:7384 stop:7656 length:273 start_codon:yes stop_codon:yes gene_type:complete